MRFLKYLLLPLLGILFLLTSCGGKKEKPLLATSIFPLTWVVENVYPTYEVYQLVKPGQNPHLYDLTPRDAVAVERAKKVFLIGNLEPFAKSIPPEKRVEVIKLLKLPESANPHLWLSPKRWLAFAEKLPSVEGLKIDRNRWERLIGWLQRLDAEYKSLTPLGLKVVMVHPAFVWLCRDYNLEVLAILETHGGVGISPKTFTQTVETLKNLPDKGRVLILYATTNPKGREIAEKLSSLTGVKAVGLDPLVEYERGNYTQLMEENLRKLLKAVGK